MPTIRLLSEKGNERSGFVAPGDFLRLDHELRVRDPDVADVVCFAYATGWRREEVLGLQWRDIQGDAALLPSSRSKSGKPRLLPLAGQVADVIARRRELRRLDCQAVFHRRGKPIRDFRAIWRQAVAGIGQPKLLLHDLRRSFARNAIAAGVDPHHAMLLGGWETPSVFRRYSIAQLSDLTIAQERMATHQAQTAGPTVVPLRKLP